METIFNIFEKYGWYGILGILICCIIFFGFSFLYKKFFNNISTGLEEIGEKLADQMSNQNDKLMDCIVDQQKQLVDYLINKDAHDLVMHNNMVNERMELAEDINMSLKDIMNIHNAQRAFIVEFHNSYSNLSGVPFAKFSCNYEWFDKGLIPLSSKCMGLPFSSMARIVSDIIQSPSQQKIYNDMTKLEEENPVIFSYVGDHKTTMIVYTGMYDKNNILIGLLVLEYQGELDPNKINLNQLRIQAAELTSILNIRYKYSSH